jgi:hypothetical protein
MDTNYVVQGVYPDERICETDGDDDVEAAIKRAERMRKSPTFEGTSVRVISRDGEMEWCWESPRHRGKVEFKERRGGFLEVRGVEACFQSGDGEDLVATGDVVLPPVLTPNCDRDASISFVQKDEPAAHFPALGRQLTDAEEESAKEALFQAACDRARERN